MAGIPRHMLPQIPSEKYDEFQDFLRGNGVAVKLLPISVTVLKPIQAHVNREKIDKFKDDPTALSKPIIVTKGGLILDGHHRFLAAKELDPNAKIPCIVAMCGIKQLVELGHEFDGSFTKTVHEWTEWGSQGLEKDKEPSEIIVRKPLKWC